MSEQHVWLITPSIDGGTDVVAEPSHIHVPRPSRVARDLKGARPSPCPHLVDGVGGPPGAGTSE